MKTIELSQGKVALVDDADFDRVNQFKWCALKQGLRFYAVRNSSKKDGISRHIRMHLFLMPGIKPLDHQDGDGLNNQKENLRPANKRQNGQAFQRKREGTTSQFRGVSWFKRYKRWRATLYFNKKHIHLGLFLSEKDAAMAYDKAARKFFGEFASPNFPI